MLDVLGKPRSLTVHVAERLGQVDRHIGSTDKAAAARSAGGPRTSFDDGLERTVAWYRDNEAWWRAILGSGAARLLVLGAGPAQLGLLEAARERGL